jgi:hypothetical protein
MSKLLKIFSTAIVALSFTAMLNACNVETVEKEPTVGEEMEELGNDMEDGMDEMGDNIEHEVEEHHDHH